MSADSQELMKASLAIPNLSAAIIAALDSATSIVELVKNSFLIRPPADYRYPRGPGAGPRHSLQLVRFGLSTVTAECVDDYCPQGSRYLEHVDNLRGADGIGLKEGTTGTLLGLRALGVLSEGVQVMVTITCSQNQRECGEVVSDDQYRRQLQWLVLGNLGLASEELEWSLGASAGTDSKAVEQWLSSRFRLQLKIDVTTSAEEPVQLQSVKVMVKVSGCFTRVPVRRRLYEVKTAAAQKQLQRLQSMLILRTIARALLMGSQAERQGEHLNRLSPFHCRLWHNGIMLLNTVVDSPAKDIDLARQGCGQHTTASCWREWGLRRFENLLGLSAWASVVNVPLRLELPTEEPICCELGNSETGTLPFGCTIHLNSSSFFFFSKEPSIVTSALHVKPETRSAEGTGAYGPSFSHVPRLTPSATEEAHSGRIAMAQDPIGIVLLDDFWSLLPDHAASVDPAEMSVRCPMLVRCGVLSLVLHEPSRRRRMAKLGINFVMLSLSAVDADGDLDSLIKGGFPFYIISRRSDAAEGSRRSSVLPQLSETGTDSLLDGELEWTPWMANRLEQHFAEMIDGSLTIMEAAVSLGFVAETEKVLPLLRRE